MNGIGFLIRCREALAGCRGAALTYRFWYRQVKAVLQKHILSLQELWSPSQGGGATKYILSRSSLMSFASGYAEKKYGGAFV